jgi:hypothetical protein
MIRRLFTIVAIVSFGLVFASLAIGYTEQQFLRPLAESYVRLVPQALGAPNVITGILLTYRGFDTLGEVAVLFMVAASVGLVLGAGRSPPSVSSEDRPEEARPPSEIVRSSRSAHFHIRSLYHHEWSLVRGRRLPGRRRDRLWRFADAAGLSAIPAQSRIP